VTRAIADTSVFIASEAGWPLGDLPDEIAVLVVTVDEPELGVLRASVPMRAVRLKTLGRVRSEYALRGRAALCLDFGDRPTVAMRSMTA
jgi:hypothetical protein